MCIIEDLFFLSVFSPPPLFLDKEAAIGHPHLPLLFGSSIDSGRQDEEIKMGYLKPTILLWLDNVARFWVAWKRKIHFWRVKWEAESPLLVEGPIRLSSRGVFLWKADSLLLSKGGCYRWCWLCPWRQWHIPISTCFFCSCPFFPRVINLHGAEEPSSQ